MAPGRRLHRPPAALGLVVGAVVLLRLHVNAQLILVCAGRQGPLQRRQGGHGDPGGTGSRRGVTSQPRTGYCEPFITQTSLKYDSNNKEDSLYVKMTSKGNR